MMKSKFTKESPYETGEVTDYCEILGIIEKFIETPSKIHEALCEFNANNPLIRLIIETIAKSGTIEDLKTLHATLEKRFFTDNAYLLHAKLCSLNSYAVRRKVGCVIVKDERIISDGYNGTPSGFPNVCEDILDMTGKRIEGTSIEQILEAKAQGLRLVTKDCVLHAEANAITKLTKSGDSTKGAYLYCTDEPCIECAKLIIQAGISKVFYYKEYRNHNGIDLLEEAGIQIIPFALHEEILCN